MDDRRSQAPSPDAGPFADEPSGDADLAPEVHNGEQEDEEAQAQTLADEALGRSSRLERGATERGGSSDPTGDNNAQDLVDHMNQMVTSGRIDMSAFRGERTDDDNEDELGLQGREDDLPSDGAY